jgi:outer membrane biosynthesis protein TonB
MSSSLRCCIALIAALALCSAVRADTVVMKTGEVLEGTVVSENDRSIELEVEFGTMRVPRARILRIEEDTPEKIAAREKKAADEKELADQMKEEGKVLFHGKWVDEKEKKQAEDKIAKDKKKSEDERKKKAADEAKRKQDEAKKQQDQAKANQNSSDNVRQDRFNQRHWRDGTQFNNNTNGYANSSSTDRNNYRNNYSGNYNNSSNYSNTLNSLYQRGSNMLNLNNKW